jgi:ATP-binding cassette subfamily B protein
MVKNFNLLPKTLASYESKMDGLLTSGYRKYRVTRLLQGATDLTMVTSDFFSLLVGAIFVFRRQMTFGSYLAFMNSFWRSATTLMEIFREWADLHSQGETLCRVVAFTVHGAASQYHRQGDRVSLENVTYAYGTTEVISGFSLALSSGERALVVGRNGSGKTTLANILSGYLAPSSGHVVLPERISFVTLPIAFPPIRTAELGVAPVYLEMFGLASQGIMDSTADNLSAGQQQKLALALALSKDADLYILDEPLANLDVESRSVAMRAIFERTRGRALIVIMHGADEHRGAFHKVIPLGEATLEMSLAS